MTEITEQRVCVKSWQKLNKTLSEKFDIFEADGDNTINPARFLWQVSSLQRRKNTVRNGLASKEVYLQQNPWKHGGSTRFVQDAHKIDNRTAFR